MTSHLPEGPDSPIESYLDALLACSSVADPRGLRRLLAEAEAHLYDDAARLEATGVSRHDAQAQAVRSFGPPGALAAAERDRRRAPVALVLRQVVGSALLLGGIGGIAVGASGLLAAGVWLTAGQRFVAAVAPGQVLSAVDCARWLAADHGARTCADAAAADWAAEVVGYRLATGVLGALALLAFWLLSGRSRTRARRLLLPAMVLDCVGFVLFALAAATTLALGVDAFAAASGDGSGQWLSAAVVSTACAAVFGWRLLGDIRSDVDVRAPAAPERSQ